MKKIKVVAIVGESASGKTYLSRKWVEEKGGHEIISSTTRPSREGEVDGVDYHFITEAQFKEKTFVEQTIFRGWHYGTQLENLDPEKLNIGVFSPEGVYQLFDNPNIELYIVRVRAFEKTRLLRQLLREKNPDVREIWRRWQADREDFMFFDEWIEYHSASVYYYDNDGQTS